MLKLNKPQKRPLRSKVAGATIVLLSMSGLGVVLAAPAQAAETQYACTVKAAKPVYTLSVVNNKPVHRVDYPVTITCNKARWVNLKQDRYEDKPILNTHLGSTTWNNVYVPKGVSKTLHNVRTAVNTEPGNEEVFHRVRFQEGLDGLWSQWKGPFTSANTSVPV